MVPAYSSLSLNRPQGDCRGLAGLWRGETELRADRPDLGLDLGVGHLVRAGEREQLADRPGCRRTFCQLRADLVDPDQRPCGGGDRRREADLRQIRVELAF